MNWVKRYFDPAGRTGRIGYWRFQIAAAVIVALIEMLTVAVTNVGGPGAAPFALIVPVALAAFIVGLRRMHDRGRSIWWALFFTFAPFGLVCVAAALVGTHNQMNTVFSLPFSLVGLALSVWAFLEFGLLRGTRGPNRYGAEPRS